jgi:uncharacterized repeat protein (TIGR01451 family)
MREPKKDKTSSSNKTIWVILGVLVLLAAAAGILYYYFAVYLKPGLDDLDLNYMASSTPQKISPKDIIDYEISYHNAGNKEVSDFKIELFVPEHTTLLQEGFQGAYDASQKKVLFAIGTLAKDQNGKILFSVIADHPLDDGTRIEAPSMTFSYVIGSEKTSFVLANEITHIIESSPDMTLSAVRLSDQSQGELRLGDIIFIAFDIENAGDMAARNVTVESSLPANTTLLEEHTFPNTARTENQKIVWDIAQLDSGASKTFQYAIVLGEGLSDRQDILIEAKVQCSTCEQKKAAAKEQVRLYPDFSRSTVAIEDVDGEFLWPGDTIKVIIELVNSGQREAQDIRLLCPMPAGTTYVSQSGTTQGISWSDEIRGLVWDIDMIEKAQTKQLSFDAVVSSELINGARISTDFRIMEQGMEYEIANAAKDVKGNFSQTIVAIGDSLIALSDWVQRVEGMLEQTYPRTDYTAVASGVGGEQAPSGYNRFASSVAIHEPDIIIIAYGTNDVENSISKYRYYLDGLAKKAKETGALVFIQNFGPIITEEHPDKEGYEEYIAVCRQVAQENNIPYIDVYSRLSQNPSAYLIDWVHYSPAGSALVSETVFGAIVPYLDGYGVRQ